MSKVLAGRYELFDRIGEGGMSVVYKAKDKLLNRFVAIKILKPEFINDHKFIDSFRRESQNAASMSHPNIVNIYDVGREGNIHYIVMELIEGRALSDYIKEQGPMPYPKVIAISKQIASALAFAHKSHIIHRDVKPHNVMITPNGTAKITDFGIAKAVNAATIVDNTDGIVGSVHYFSPEQARGGYVDEKSDIYSLGIVMYEMLTGEVPFDGDNPVNIALKHINEEITPPSKLVQGVPPALEHIIMKCTDKYPVNRYASADELIQALNNIEFVSNIVDPDVFAGGRSRQNQQSGPIAVTDYDDGDDYLDPEEPKKKRKGGSAAARKKKRLIIIIAAAAVALIAGIIAAVAIFGGEEIEAPDFTGMTLEEAQLQAEEFDLKIKEGDEVVSEDVEKGCIVNQDPLPGEIIKTGSTVTVNISKGLGDGSVPDLTGKDVDDVDEYLQAAGFELGNITEKASEKAEGTVLSQDPVGGSSLEKGSKVNVVVSDGSLNKATVPYLIGKSLDDATAALNAAGLKVGSVSSEYSSSAAKGEVINQQYSSNTQLKKNSSVNLTISKGPKPTEAPTAAPTVPVESPDEDE